MREAEVSIRFPHPTKEQLKHLSNTQDELYKAGVYFDSGSAVGCKNNCLSRDWEFDWSLTGAKVKFVRFKEDK